jgi:hypothetical protein
MLKLIDRGYKAKTNLNNSSRDKRNSFFYKKYNNNKKSKIQGKPWKELVKFYN